MGGGGDGGRCGRQEVDQRGRAAECVLGRVVAFVVYKVKRAKGGDRKPPMG